MLVKTLVLTDFGLSEISDRDAQQFEATEAARWVKVLVPRRLEYPVHSALQDVVRHTAQPKVAS